MSAPETWDHIQFADRPLQAAVGAESGQWGSGPRWSGASSRTGAARPAARSARGPATWRRRPVAEAAAPLRERVWSTEDVAPHERFDY